MNAATMSSAQAMGALRRVGVIGDVHTEDKLLARAIETLKGLGVDAIVCVGDITDGHNRESGVARCCTLLKQEQVMTVCGNHDRWTAEDEQRDLEGATLRDDLAPDALKYLNALPTSIALDTVAGRALLCHGLEGNDMLGVKPFDHGIALSNNDALQAMLSPRVYDFVLNGHTHHRMLRNIEGLTIVNAGTLHRDHDPGFVVVDFAERVVQWFDFNVEGQCQAGELQPLPSAAN